MATPRQRPYIPKLDPKMPDFWEVTIYYISGKEETFEVIAQTLRSQEGYWELQLTDDTIQLIYIHDIRRVGFSKDYRAVVEAKNRAQAASAQTKR